MEKIFDQAKDKNVAAIVVYGKGTDGKAYVDAAGTTQYKTSALKDAFLKRAIVQIGSDYFVPVSFTVASNVGTLTYAKAGTTTGAAATATTATLVAVAD